MADNDKPKNTETGLGSTPVFSVSDNDVLLPFEVCEQAVSTFSKCSLWHLHKNLSAIPTYPRRPYNKLSWQPASSLPACHGLALCLLWLLLSSPRVCTGVVKRHFDGVLLPLLPSLNRSCCHLYFDLCIPWSIYAREIGEGRGGRGAGRVEGVWGRGKRKTTTATMLRTIPRGTPAVHLPFSLQQQTSKAQQQSDTKLRLWLPRPPTPSLLLSQ